MSSTDTDEALRLIEDAIKATEESLGDMFPEWVAADLRVLARHLPEKFPASAGSSVDSSGKIRHLETHWMVRCQCQRYAYGDPMVVGHWPCVEVVDLAARHGVAIRR